MKAEELLENLTKNCMGITKIEAKADVHFFGQIVGASKIVDDHGYYCEAFFDAGKFWQLRSPPQSIHTQTSYANVLKINLIDNRGLI